MSQELDNVCATQGRREVERISGRFMALRDIRLMRLRDLLSGRRQEVLDLLPLLFHLNHENLPAFVGSDVPCGLVCPIRKNCIRLFATIITSRSPNMSLAI